MTRKDYILIADLLNCFQQMESDGCWETGDGELSRHAWLVREFSDFLAKDNPRFDRTRFREACERKEE